MKPRLPFDQFVQRRVRKLCYLLAFVYCILGARLFYIQVIRASFFKPIAAKRNVKIPLLAKRGTIYDRNGKKLAVSVDAYDIYVDPTEIKNKADVAGRLAPLIGYDRSRLLDIFSKRGRFTYLRRRADVQLWAKIKELKLPGVGANPTMKRVYPGGTLAAHIIGFTDVDGIGIEGLERVYDRTLRGCDGYIEAEIDARRNIIPVSRKERVEPVNGKDITLTIDSTLQHCLEMELEKTYKAHSAVGASAVVIDPKTGEILALANMPTYNPNDVAGSGASDRRNRAVTDLYEPGSTLKTMTVCGALEDKAISTSDTFYCRGSMRIGRRTVQCSLHAPFLNGHGSCNAAKTLRYSCNMAAAGIGLRMGKEKLHEYESAFGLYENPDSGLPGEQCGWRDRWQDWPDVRVANIAFGQGIAVTPVQLAKAYSAVANGGLMMRPFIVKEITGLDGKPEMTFSPRVVRRVISKETACLVSEMLRGVVAGGTGKTARVEGYRVAGKTGSAQKASTTGRGYVGGKFIASFVGFLPVTDPRVVILVAVDEPKGTHWGATVAAPVFQQVAREAMWRMKVPPDELPKQSPPIADKGGKASPHTNRGDPSGRTEMGG